MNKDILHELFFYKDGKLFWKENRGKNQCKNKQAGCISKSGYRDVRINGKLYREHRIIFLMHNNFYPKCIDHINNNSLDNRIENLRESSFAQNSQNRKLSITNKSNVKGVSWHKKSQKWMAQIQVNNKKIYLGTFEKLELAELVSIEARNKHHKEFANHG